MRGILTAFVAVLFVASGVWAASAGAALGPAAGTATDGAVDGSGAATTVTTTVPTGTTVSGTATNTTDSTETTNSTETIDPTNVTDTTDSTNDTNTTGSTGTADAIDDGTTTDDVTNATVNESVDGGTTNGSIGAGTTDDATLNGSVSGPAADTELAVNGSGVTASTTAGGDGPLAVSTSADATGGTATDSADSSDSTATSDATRTTASQTETPTATGTPGGNATGGADSADGGSTDTGASGDVPAAATGAVLLGFGAAAAGLLARGSATISAFAPNLAATISRFPSPVAQLKQAGRRWLPRVLAAVGYSRYDDSDPLTHTTRAELYDHIADSPGTYLSELSERTDVPTSTVRHHLDVLVSEGVVTTANVRGKRRYFPLDAGNEALAAALEDDASAAVIECLARTGPASVSTVAEELDRDVSTVSHHLGRLAADGLVERDREGRSVYNELAPEVEDALGADGADRDTRRE